MKKICLIVGFLIASSHLLAQADTTMLVRVPVDTDPMAMNMDAIYNRPFLKFGRVPAAVGGFVDSNSSYFVTDGETDGLSFQIPCLTVFMSSSLTKRIKFLTEVEFEGSTKRVNLDYAAVDIELHPLVNLRGGVIINPIGGFNQNHDGPRWEFVSRPISATTIIPSVWCNSGFGLYGKYRKANFAWGYEAYITNGFDDRIIINALSNQSRTWLSASKQNPDRLMESFNGVPLLTFKTAVRHSKVGELGISWMGGVYNKFEENGVTIDKRRRVDLIAVDFNTKIPKLKTAVTGEWVWAFIDIPSTYTQQFGEQQAGGFIDIVQPILQRKMLGWDDAVLNLNLRTEYVDYNVDTFTETGGNIFDHLVAIVPGISFRPSQQTVIRANYRHHWQWDLFGNPPAKTAGFQFGVSTYF
jgi:hypothetical protein